MKTLNKLKDYLLLWSTQSLSALGSGITSYALVLWLYERTGSALQTALLSICSYMPYVIMSIFAGALSDRWNKKRTMLCCDAFAALCTVAVAVLLKNDMLVPWHMYVLNAMNGLMNTIQTPASDVAATLLIPKEYYQKTSGLRSFSMSLNTILTPVIASVLYAFSGMYTVIAVDLVTFAVAFLTLLFFIRIPEKRVEEKSQEGLIESAKSGLVWLRDNKLITCLIMFLAFINLVASAYDAALPALILNREYGGEQVLGLVNAMAGIATLIGSIVVMLLPSPKNRVRVICIALLISMGTENFFLSFGKAAWIYCVGSILGWIVIPVMNANMDVIFRTTIPEEMQGRVFSCRNTLQFFSIPLGLFLGGWLVDEICEPFMMSVPADSLPALLWGVEKGSGAAFLFCLLGIAGVAVCLIFSWILRKE